MTVDYLERVLGRDKSLTDDTLLYLLNTTEYSAPLEAYFEHVGKGGILYGAYNQYSSQAPLGIGMRYTYIYPSRLKRQASYSGVARVRKGNTYDYNVPAIAFGSVTDILGQPNSRPGYKIGKGGRLRKSRTGRKYK